MRTDSSSVPGTIPAATRFICPKNGKFALSEVEGIELTFQYNLPACWKGNMKIALPAVLVLLTSTQLFAADPEPYLKAVPIPFYPVIAHTARVQGTVTLHATVNEQGNTSDIVATSGHPLLKEAAIQNVKDWKFAWSGSCPCRSTREITFVYKLSGKLESQESPAVTIRWFGKKWDAKDRREIEADELPVNVQTSH